MRYSPAKMIPPYDDRLGIGLQRYETSARRGKIFAGSVVPLSPYLARCLHF
jgi:hypothetical protein